MKGEKFTARIYNWIGRDNPMGYFEYRTHVTEMETLQTIASSVKRIKNAFLKWMVGVSKIGVAELTCTVALSRDFSLSHPNFVRGMHVILRPATVHLFYSYTTASPPTEIRTHHKEWPSYCDGLSPSPLHSDKSPNPHNPSPPAHSTIRH